MSLWTTYGK